MVFQKKQQPKSFKNFNNKKNYSYKSKKFKTKYNKNRKKLQNIFYFYPNNGCFSDLTFVKMFKNEKLLKNFKDSRTRSRELFSFYMEPKNELHQVLNWFSFRLGKSSKIPVKSTKVKGTFINSPLREYAKKKDKKEKKIVNYNLFKKRIPLHRYENSFLKSSFKVFLRKNGHFTHFDNLKVYNTYPVRIISENKYVGSKFKMSLHDIFKESSYSFDFSNKDISYSYFLEKRNNFFGYSGDNFYNEHSPENIFPFYSYDFQTFFSRRFYKKGLRLLYGGWGKNILDFDFLDFFLGASSLGSQFTEKTPFSFYNNILDDFFAKDLRNRVKNFDLFQLSKTPFKSTFRDKIFIVQVSVRKSNVICNVLNSTYKLLFRVTTGSLGYRTAYMRKKAPAVSHIATFIVSKIKEKYPNMRYYNLEVFNTFYMPIWFWETFTYPFERVFPLLNSKVHTFFAHNGCRLKRAPRK